MVIHVIRIDEAPVRFRHGPPSSGFIGPQLKARTARFEHEVLGSFSPSVHKVTGLPPIHYLWVVCLFFLCSFEALNKLRAAIITANVMKYGSLIKAISTAAAVRNIAAEASWSCRTIGSKLDLISVVI